MIETVYIKGDLILRRANQPVGSNAFRFVVRWILTKQAGDGLASADSDVRLPRVRFDPGTGAYDSDRFRLRIYRTGRDDSAKEYFDFRALDFVPNPTGDTETVVEPQLDAVLRPKSRLRWIRETDNASLETADSSEALWCATPDASLRPFDSAVGAPAHNLHSFIDGTAEPLKDSLAVRELLFDADDAAGRGEQYNLLRQRFDETITRLDLSALHRAFGGKESHEGGEAEEIVSRLQARLMDDHAHRLALRLLALPGTQLFDPLTAIERIEHLHRQTSRRIEQAGRASPEDVDDLVDLAVIARALAPRPGEKGLAFLDALAEAGKRRASDRENLALSTVHGGRWFVYNYDQLSAGGSFPCETDAPPGQAAGPELVGLGYHTPPIAEQRVRSWAAQGGRIGIEIEPVPLPPSAAPHREGDLFFESDPRGWTSHCAARIWASQEDRKYEACDAVRILSRDLAQLAPPRNGWTTLPLGRCAAELLLDAVQLSPQLSSEPSAQGRPGTDPTSLAAPTYPTGDTAIQLVFGPEDPKRKHARGYNIYAVWEDGSDDGAIPDLPSLRPWLVNARYSFLTDIYHAARIDAGQAPAGIFATLIASPPDNPVVPRPAFADDDRLQRTLAAARPVSEDLTSPIDGGDLPDLDIYRMSAGLSGRKTFHHDLRSGTQAPAASKDATWQGFGDRVAQHQIRWDPRGLVAADVRARELPNGVPWRRGIDRYRLFVTATDMFGQETEPVPVETHSAFMSQNGVAVGEGVYRPVSRRPVLDPPSEEPQAQPPTTRRIAFNPGQHGGELVVDFSTPFINEVDLGSAWQARFMASDELEAELLLLRKFIMPEDQGLPEEKRFSARGHAGPFPFDLDVVWREHLGLERLAGFFPYRGFVVGAPHRADRWRQETTLPPSDHGYEYKAAIRFRLKEQARKHWFPDEPARRFHHFVPPAAPGGDWTAAISITPEIVTRGMIGVTGSASALNRIFLPAPPLPAADPEILAAVPIGAVPQADRDVALFKLLTRQVITGSSVERRIEWPRQSDPYWSAWDGRRFKMSLGQAAVMDAAVQRVPIGPTYQTAWRPLVELLAIDMGEQRAPGTDQSQGPEDAHERRVPVIGLRGAVKLSWDYMPVAAGQASSPPNANQVDASEFRIYVVRIPAEAERRGTSQLGTVQLKAGAVEFELPRQNDQESGTPAAVPPHFVLARRDAPGTFLVRRHADGVRCSILPEDQARWAAERGRLMMFDIYPLEHIWTIPEDGRRSYAYYFPVGGGYEETIRWMVQSFSSAQTVAPDAISFTASFPSSITPPPITGFSAQPLFDVEEAWFRPGQVGFFPSLFLQGDTGRHLRGQPRLKLAWNVEMQPGDAGLVIHKEARSIWDEGLRLADAGTEIVAAIQRIAALPAGEAIANSDIDLIRPWLEGRFNWSGTSDQRHAFWRPLAARPQKDPRFLPARGLPYGGTKPGHGFLDYFHDIRFPAAGEDRPIEYDHEYRYSIASYVDLGEELPDGARFLVSDATPYSDWLAPPMPSWSIDAPQISFANDTRLATPQVRLFVELVDRRNLAKALGARLGFSIEAARLLEGQLVGSSAGDQHFVSVDRNLQLLLAAPDDGGSMSGVIKLERVGRLFPDRETNVSLRLTFGAYLASGTNRLLLQEQVRNIDLIIPPMRPGDPGEKLCDTTLKIFVG